MCKVILLDDQLAEFPITVRKVVHKYLKSKCSSHCLSCHIFLTACIAYTYLPTCLACPNESGQYVCLCACVDVRVASILSCFISSREMPSHYYKQNEMLGLCPVYLIGIRAASAAGGALSARLAHLANQCELRPTSCRGCPAFGLFTTVRISVFTWVLYNQCTHCRGSH